MYAEDYGVKPIGHIEVIRRIAISYCIRPNEIVPHLRNISVPPIISGLPMLTFGAIRYLRKNLKSDFTVFEFGCGGSTKFFSQRCRSVVAVEQFPDWKEKIEQRCSNNVEIKLIPEDQHSKSLDRIYDIILVDGWADRQECFASADKFARHMVIVDDAHWPLDLKSDRSTKLLRFPGLGPYRYAPSQTDIYLYGA